jgi:lipopolysaccharide/colanic/teichoic acid biosynthesis glycosyltransferase
VPPGLAGLAQVIGSYYMSPEEKLSWDRRYLEHANLGFDLKLLALAVVLVFFLRWGKNESLPRRWLGLG